MSEKIFSFLENSKSHYIIVSFLLTVGACIRLFGITLFPVGFNQDEASIGYEAFCILSSGIDRTGNTLPMHFVSWGSGQNALYAYLSIPFIKLFGLNIFSVRIVNALLGTLSLWVFYALYRLISTKKNALIGLALLTICPWSIMASRWGLESNIFPTLFLIALFFLLKGIYTSHRYYSLSFFLFAVSLYSYGTSYLVVPIFLIIISIYLFKTKQICLKKWIAASLIFTLTAFPILLFILINHFDLAQIKLNGITIPRLDSNRTTEIFNILSPGFAFTIIKNALRLLNILIFQTDGNDYNAIGSIGTVYLVSFPLFIIGFWNNIKDLKLTKDPHQFIFIAWFGVAILLGLTSHVNINRINIIFFPILYFIVNGIQTSIHALKLNYQIKFKALLLITYTTFFILFIGYYATFFQNKMEKDFSGGLGEAIQYVEKNIPEGNVNITTNSVNMPYIYVCFFNQIKPQYFRKNVVYAKSTTRGFCEVKSLGRYHFGNSTTKDIPIHILSSEELNLLNINLHCAKKFGNYYVVNQNIANNSR